MAREHVPSADLVCPKCHMFGCDCVSPPAPTVRHDWCNVCRRGKAKCICRSHVPHTPAGVDKYGELFLKVDTQSDKVDAAVKELKYFWYDTRDAAAAERLVRELATLAYRSVRQPAEA